MRNLFNKVKNYGVMAVIRAKSALSDKKGEGFVDTAVKIFYDFCAKNAQKRADGAGAPLSCGP